MRSRWSAPSQATADGIAAVIVEPVAGNMNLVAPRPGFLELLRKLCTRHGTVLIFDEVMTGFRVALGGAQALYGIKPDLTTLGKVIGGGMPVGAFGGRRDIMQKIAPLGPVYQAGTLSGNPVAVAAGLATLKLVQAPGFFDRLGAATRMLCEGLARAAQERGIPFSAQNVGGMFGLYFRETPPTELRRSHAMRQGGIQPLFPCHARGGHLPRAVGLRSGICFQRARRRGDRADHRRREENLQGLAGRPFHD